MAEEVTKNRNSKFQIPPYLDPALNVLTQMRLLKWCLVGIYDKGFTLRNMMHNLNTSMPIQNF